jgi:hypothetical protein
MSAPVFAVAPGFHLDGSWAGRLQIGQPWRAPSEAELASLVVSHPDAGPAFVCLFQIPVHLREAFWAALERDGALPQEEARGFFVEVAKFLEYKGIAPPPGCIFEIIARRVGEAPIIPPPAGPLIWGAVNLGNEATHAVFAVGETAVRLRLEPGEGYRLPAGGMPVGGCTLGKEEPEVLLRVRPPEAGPG